MKHLSLLALIPTVALATDPKPSKPLVAPELINTLTAYPSATANPIATVTGDQNEYRARALALSLPGLVAAPAVAGECLEHLRGGGALSAGVTGRTRLNPECMARQHCLAIADRLAAYRAIQAAMDQLATCGGVAAKAPIVEAPKPAEPMQGYVPRAEYEQWKLEQEEKQKRLLERATAK